MDLFFGTIGTALIGIGWLLGILSAWCFRQWRDKWSQR